MKTGVIVYITGGGPQDDALDINRAVKSLNIDADRVEHVSRNSGHFDVPDAWWSLTVKGMQRIVCMMGEITPGGLKLTGRELRLQG